jgi:hypothetical protein
MILFSARTAARLGCDREGFTPAERRALARKQRESARARDRGSVADAWGVWRCGCCGLVEPCGQAHGG